MNTSKISLASKAILIITALLLIASAFVPLWQIDLDAPQYPEGLNLKIYPDKIGGDVEIINGLNHYIGMKTLHTKDFIEFSVLKYIIFAYAALALLAAIYGRKKIVYLVFTLFVLFGILAMYDFWRWEYNYGHDLDPNAAIIVPGMAYQPPLIGFKQLLNFGAYSIPDTGGWLFITSGLLMLIVVIKEAGVLNRFSKKGTVATILVLCLNLLSCSTPGPEPIRLNKDNCNYCKMSLSDERFNCEIVTEKGKVYKFDDMHCMIDFSKENKEKMEEALYYVSDFISPHSLQEAGKMFFIKGENVSSPMSGNIAAFSNKDSAAFYQNNISAEQVAWATIKP